MNRDKLLELISFIGTVVSIISFFFLEVKWSMAKIILMIALIVLLVLAVYFLFIKRDTKTYKSQEEINEFMKNWIKTNGVVKIFSRDLSWLDDEMYGILQAKGEDLYLYVEKKNEKIEKILQMNPEGKIFFYEDIGFIPSSRFTIIRANKDEKQIAIAIKEQKDYKNLKHVIYISKDSDIDKKILGLANDLMNCMECKRKKND